MSWNVGLLGRRGEREVGGRRAALGRWTKHPAPSPTAAFQAGAADEVILSGSPPARAAGCPLPPGATLCVLTRGPQRECFAAKGSAGLPVPTALETVRACPDYTRPAKFEARVLDRDAGAQRGGGAGLGATAAQNAARGREPRSVGGRPGPQPLRLAERRADLALTWGGGARSVSRSPLSPTALRPTGLPSLTRSQSGVPAATWAACYSLLASVSTSLPLQTAGV